MPSVEKAQSVVQTSIVQGSNVSPPAVPQCHPRACRCCVEGIGPEVGGLPVGGGGAVLTDARNGTTTTTRAVGGIRRSTFLPCGMSSSRWQCTTGCVRVRAVCACSYCVFMRMKLLLLFMLSGLPVPGKPPHFCTCSFCICLGFFRISSVCNRYVCVCNRICWLCRHGAPAPSAGRGYASGSSGRPNDAAVSRSTSVRFTGGGMV